jgi:hypothetical protein
LKFHCITQKLNTNEGLVNWRRQMKLTKERFKKSNSLEARFR